ncbi:MAG: dTDP-4-dehydrorhamnose reductase [Planctomycetota bacterium]
MSGTFLITGALGQLGRALAKECEARGIPASSSDLDTLDVTDRAAVEAEITRVGPSWVLHCAAATMVDRCESETGWAEELNAVAPGIVARAARRAGACMVHFSTDFVFDGKKGSPYLEDDPIHPLSVYGATKARGDARVLDAGLEAFLLLRTQWVYGPGGRNFPAAILAKARAGEELRVVDDQVGAPSFSRHIAAATLDLIEAQREGRAEPGIYNVANRGILSWFGFARMILSEAGLDGVPLRPVPSQALDQPAARPVYSALELQKIESALGRSMPRVEEGLRAWLAAETSDEERSGRE